MVEGWLQVSGLEMKMECYNEYGGCNSWKFLFGNGLALLWTLLPSGQS